jgi:hypothetical protein
VIDPSYPGDGILDDVLVSKLRERYAEPTVFELDSRTMFLDVKWLLRKNRRLEVALKSCLDNEYLPKQEHDETENTK